MHESAWVYQPNEEIRRVGKERASWYVGWRAPNGKNRKKSFGPGAEGKRKAEKHRKKLEAELLVDVYQDQKSKSWDAFREEYVDVIGTNMEHQTLRITLDAMNHFARLVKPTRVFLLSTRIVDEYVTARRQEPGKKRGSKVSAATINKELRHLRAVFKIARRWGYLTNEVEFRMLREHQDLPTYVTGDHFALIYGACDVATRPADYPHLEPADWWRALITFAYMTGWRISEILAARRDDLDGDNGTIITRAGDNKGKRTEQIKLHPVVLQHLARIATFSDVVFPWPHDTTTLHNDFHRIQKEAGIFLPCHEDHEHTHRCHFYGFHDLRRAFATMNADKLSADALQKLMRHKSYLTTQKYINMARQMDEVVESLHVPEVLRRVGE